jgi:hypothetical protein
VRDKDEVARAVAAFARRPNGSLYQTADTLTHPRHRPRLRMAPISHWTTVRFCNGCPSGRARSIGQGLRVLVLVVTASAAINLRERPAPLSLPPWPPAQQRFRSTRSPQRRAERDRLPAPAADPWWVRLELVRRDLCGDRQIRSHGHGQPEVSLYRQICGRRFLAGRRPLASLNLNHGIACCCARRSSSFHFIMLLLRPCFSISLST